MGAMESKAAAVAGPIAAADATGKTGVYRYASSTSNASAAIPSAWAGKELFLRVLSTGCNTQVAFSLTGSAATLAYNQAAALGTGHAAAGGTCVDSVPEHFPVPKTASHISWISSAAGGYVELYLSERMG